MKSNDINKKRNKDKWILPKNNNKISRHRTYVAFVTNFFFTNNKFPTVEEYLENIIPFLVKSGENKANKKTSDRHQLYHPVFFNMLIIENNIVRPSKLGIAFLLDIDNLYLKDIIFRLFWNSTFSSGATGSSIKYNYIFPIRELMQNIYKYEKVYFYELNKKFWGTNENIDIKTIEDCPPGSEPKWNYVLSMMGKASLIEIIGNKSYMSVKNPNYNPNGYIKINLGKPILSEDKILKKFNITSEMNAKIFYRNFKNIQSKSSSKTRDSIQQKSWKQLLWARDKGCIICNIKIYKLTIASHIKDYSKSEDDEKFDINNGITLCCNHDKLFDNKLITFDENGSLLVSKSIKSDWDDIEKMRVNEKIHIENKMMKYFEWHKNIFDINERLYNEKNKRIS